MKTRHYVITAVVSYIVFLLFTAPAAPVLNMLLEQGPQFRIQGISGTLWNGRAQSITIKSSHTLTNLNWSFTFWRLLTGELAINFDTKYKNQPVSGSVGIGLGNTVNLRDIRAKLDARSVGTMAGMPLGELSGIISVDLDNAYWDQETVPTANGTINWDKAAVTVAEKAELGNVSIILSESDNNPLIAKISNKGGHLKLNGQVVVNEDGKYSLELKLLPVTDASNNLKSSLAMFAKKQSDGNYVIKNSGNLQQLGLLPQSTDQPKKN